MAVPRNRSAARLVQRALEFGRRAPWREFSERDLFLVDVPAADGPMVGYVMGRLGTDDGMLLLRGPAAHDSILRTMAGEPEEQVASEQSLIGFSLDPLGEIPPPARRILDQAGFAGRRECRAPFFLSQVPGCFSRSPGSREAKILLQALSGFLDAWEAGALRPSRDPPGSALPRLVLSGRPASPDFQVIESPPPRSVSVEPLAGDVSDLERFDEIWLATLSDLDGGEVDDDGQVARALVVLDRDSGEMLCLHRLRGVGVRESAERLVRYCRGDGPSRRRGLPRVLRFSSKSLMAPVRDLFEAAGVRVEYVPSEVRLREAVTALGTEAAEGRATGPRPYGPADPVLAHWKADELDVIQAIGRRLGENTQQRDAAIEIYFGDLERGLELFEELASYSIEMAFCEWWAAHYRLEEGAPTAIETMLAEGDWTEDQRALLAGRGRAVPSLFHVEEVDPGTGTVHLLDVLTGEAATLHDQSLSECVREGLMLPLALIPAGPFTFGLLQGPPIPPIRRDQALDWLERHGLPPSTEAYAREPQRLGSLWEWFDQVKDQGPPALANTDDEPIEWHTACFSLQDPEATERALLQREDIEQPGESEPGVFVWVRPDTPERPAISSGGTVLGRIEIIGNEAILEVNSQARMERAREWLEQLPGVELVSVRTKDLLGEEPPLDDRLPHPGPDLPPAEVRAALQEFIDQQAIRWLDQSIPALGGKTPRQAIATAEGRDRVLLMIRSWPAATGPDGTSIKPPREAMMRELGLE